jgi:melibiose permease
MEEKQSLPLKSKISYALGAVGKDMVYMLSASYVLYYFQDLLRVNAIAMGIILMAARVFDAFNDPIMGVIVAKTKTRWGKFRPWLLIGTLTNAVVLVLMFAAPPKLDASGLVAYAAVTYILWGVTYTMMDIPYWSMIPAITSTPKDTENLSVIGRTCAGVGAAIMAVGTMKSVELLGGGNEREGFRYVAIIVAVIFIIAEIVCALFVREREDSSMETVKVKDMFKALFQNDQALIVVLSIVLINSALYITSNLIIYFFKYDIGGAGWVNDYTLFSTVGGVFQILGMMVVYPILRGAKLTNTGIFKICLVADIAAYLILLGLCLAGVHQLVILLIPGAVVFLCNGILSVLTTVFLSNSVDYGQLKTGHREESVIFSMQTFVVKAASGVAVFITGIGLDLIGLVGNSDQTGEIAQQSAETLKGLEFLMTILPIILLGIAILFFIRKFKLTDAVVQQNAELVQASKED